ncbi:hypothetical protein OG474_31445 [Kribbella sp. NBC_01505]|uniref:hypothetical protein n=1 Tax=Kribbella sp. NBC_01505 TaxID=2903580 RepID=UPI00387034B2
MNPNWLFLILIPVVLLFVLVPILVMKGIRRQARNGLGPAVLGAPGQNPFAQAEGETREEFVRRHWQRSGVVANGVTLVDLYDRIRVLEERLARAEQNSAS